MDEQTADRIALALESIAVSLRVISLSDAVDSDFGAMESDLNGLAIAFLETQPYVKCPVT